jgi:hypothetical protein
VGGKVDVAPLRQAIEAQPNLGPDQPTRGDVERESQQSEKNHGNAARPEG